MEYLIKWRELGYDECTWERESDVSAFKTQIERFRELEKRGKALYSGNSIHNVEEEGKRIRVDRQETPEYLKGGAWLFC